LLGLVDQGAEGWRLYKSRVGLKSGNTSSWQSFPATTFVCAQLLALIESQAIRRFVLHSGPNDAAGGFLVSFSIFNIRETHADVKIALGIQSGSALFEL
jgi:HECT-like Ubiquitin-conjugating enzyme (E2)-binding